MHAQKIMKSKHIARDMCIGDSPEICAVRATRVYHAIYALRKKYCIKATDFER